MLLRLNFHTLCVCVVWCVFVCVLQSDVVCVVYDLTDDGALDQVRGWVNVTKNITCVPRFLYR